ncbi:hypothetical protein VNO77_37512 [Canavalia gladiata]|uniref:EF-hand domain-containing protein n=1 Tax=Canavalia gladiata TaxID=3824 RepID=A0AAN9PW48_CANGL
MRSMSKIACFNFFILVITLKVEGRALQSRASEFVSDGNDDVQSKNSYLYLKDSESSGKYCEQMYGFLPCSNNILGHFFLILSYEYLLFHGESYLAFGGEQVFKILGPGIFGARVFDILRALPEPLIILVSGLISDKESAQKYAATGVGLLAGSSILLLTIVWGTCVIIGSEKLKSYSLSVDLDSSSTSIQQLLTGFGIIMEVDTRKKARIMVLSVIPLIIMQIPTLFHLSSTSSAVTLMIALIVAVIFLISTFIYQIFRPHIEKTRLEYIKHGRVILRIFQHVEKQTMQMILAEDGTPNVTTINRIFNEISQHGSKDLLLVSDIKERLLKNATETNIEEQHITEMLRIFDRNGDQIITKEEFVQGLTEFINQAKHALDMKYLPKKSLNKIYQVFIKPWIEHTRKERELKEHVISEILRHAQSDMVGRLCKDDGTPDESAIRRLFEEIDSNGDNHVSRSELENLVKGIQFINAEVAVTKVFQELDINRDNEISEKEFVDGFTKWINTISIHAPRSISLPHGNHQTWEDVEKVVEDNQSRGVYAWLGALGNVVLGITMLSLLAEPLIASVEKFSEEVGISSFFISFILVPLATNFREATSAIKEASHKKRSNTCQTIYEIYAAVFMNNILCFVVISILIFVRDITWEFSADVLIVAIVCAIMGFTSSFRSSFPLWTAIPAYLLYLISILILIVLKDVLNYV